MMDEATAAIYSPACGETWQAVAEMRWTVRTTRVYREDFPAAYDEFPQAILQQRWFCREKGKSEWRDVPTVTE